MKLLNRAIFGTILFFVSAIFSACDSYEDEAPRVDNDNSYFYFPSTELTSSERAEKRNIKTISEIENIQISLQIKS